jgi:hypothetical protein
LTSMPSRATSCARLRVRLLMAALSACETISVKGGVKPGRWGGVKVDQSMDVGLL